jgi:uncharacterized sporulation protein YeaH/YhbH (DUF444 family)
MNSPPRRAVSVARFALPRRRRVNLIGENNGSGAAAARRAAVNANVRRSLNENRNARELAEVQARVEPMRQQNAAQLATNVRGTMNRIANGHASRSQVRRIIDQLRSSPEARRRTSLAVMVSLFVAAGYLTQAMRAMMSRGNKKNALFNGFRLDQRVGR